MGFRNELAERIRDARKGMRMTQAELAAMVGVTQSSVGLYETARVTPSLVVMARISSATGRMLDELVPRVEAESLTCEGQTALELGDA
jgi:transcriptional regulator with XRE-family HTH domain